MRRRPQAVRGDGDAGERRRREVRPGHDPAHGPCGEEGNEAEEIFDGQVGGGFAGTLLPGRKATQKFAFFVPGGAKNLDVEVVVGDFGKEPATWSLPL
ncbi:hypothetical protein [Streptomyces sp. B22F1]|uniref:hypothetical protein n=1 Tax=Streptomyces sp. B22F1 TaxID=3153566 RepID=UPI00325C9B72